MFCPTITEDLRSKYPYHTEEALKGVMIIQHLEDEYLIDVVCDEGGDGPKSDAIKDAIDGHVASAWLVDTAAEELYNRNVFDREEMEHYLG